MAQVLVVSGSRALRVLLARLLGQEGYSAELARDGDEAFSALLGSRPALVILDLRDGEADSLLFHGLLRKRHPGLPVLSLLEGRLRFCDGARDVLLEPSPADDRAPYPLLAVILRSVNEAVASASLRTWRPAPGLA